MIKPSKEGSPLGIRNPITISDLRRAEPAIGNQVFGDKKLPKELKKAYSLLGVKLRGKASAVFREGWPSALSLIQIKEKVQIKPRDQKRLKGLIEGKLVETLLFFLRVRNSDQRRTSLQIGEQEINLENQHNLPSIALEIAINTVVTNEDMNSLHQSHQIESYHGHPHTYSSGPGAQRHTNRIGPQNQTRELTESKRI